MVGAYGFCPRRQTTMRARARLRRPTAGLMIPPVPAGNEIPGDPLEDLAALPDAEERLAWITDRARRTPPLKTEERCPAHRVPGCASAVWLVDESSGGRCQFRSDAESAILRGLVALACERANGRAAAEVAADDIDLLFVLHLERHLSPTRTNGLRSIQGHIRRRAAAHAELAAP